jgi:two-component system nitrate/nitrite response regulator NarL
VQPAKTIRVLIVEDHPAMLWGLERLINSERPRMEVVGTAGTPDDAIRQIAQHRPDLLLLDLDLGGLSGLDILPAVLPGSKLRALVLTGDQCQATLDRAVRTGARGIVHKDASTEHLLKAIEKTSEGELWLDHDTLARVFVDLLNPSGLHGKSDESVRQAELTTREREIVQAVVDHAGELNKVLAGRLFISEHTLRNHLTSIYQKLDVNSRLELYLYATRHMSPPPARRH